jgi:hypothetical protein
MAKKNAGPAPPAPDPMLNLKLACSCGGNVEHGAVRETGDPINGAVMKMPSGKWVPVACCPFCKRNV